MNIEREIQAYEAQTPMLVAKSDLIRQFFVALDPIAQQRDVIAGVLDELIKVGDRATIERARKLKSRLADVEPAITMIGQVKAGKTSLVNAMIGMPGLLPSDVNPWTSVVTSLHLDPNQTAAQNSARFEFLGRSDWDRLVKGGGRIGELARRAGADSELKRVTEQVAALREKSKKRLGQKFEMLLGQEHDYGYFDRDLIERYVCLGDDFEDDSDTSRDRGRFADITKSAHIHMAHDTTPLSLCIRDTPGVNDTFLIREQITMKAIRGSHLCIVVLAAHQALSSVDLALLRLISNLKSRDVIIFVNRIDELVDPATQVPEIRDSICATLKAHQGPDEAEIIFGSAEWADHLLQDRLSDLDSEGADALLNYTRAHLDTLPDGLTDDEVVWHLSGLAELQRTVAERIASGNGKTAMQAIMRSVRNLLNGIKITDNCASSQPHEGHLKDIDAPAAEIEFAKMDKERSDSLNEGLDALHIEFTDRIARVHDGYLDRATTALIQHLDTTPEGTVWNYDPTGLRMLLRSSYRTYVKRSNDLIARTFDAGAKDLSSFFERVFAMPADSYELAAPEPAPAPEPVILGKTIALDLQSSWWAKWWQKQTGAKAQTSKFRDLISAETAPVLEALRDECAGMVRQRAQAQLRDMIEDQRQVLLRMTQDGHPDTLQSSKRVTRMEVVERALAALGRD